MHERDEERTVIQHANGFPMIKTMMFERGHDHYVFPRQYEFVNLLLEHENMNSLKVQISVWKYKKQV
jgi:hypothetical protein